MRLAPLGLECTGLCMHANCVFAQSRTSQGLGLVPSWDGNPPTGYRLVSPPLENCCFSSLCCGRSLWRGPRAAFGFEHSNTAAPRASVRLGAVIVRLSQASLLFSSPTSVTIRTSGSLFHSRFSLCLSFLLDFYFRPRSIDVRFLSPNRSFASKPSFLELVAGYHHDSLTRLFTTDTA